MSKKFIEKIMRFYRTYDYQFFFFVRKVLKTKKNRQMMYAIFAPIMFVYALARMVYENTIGRLVTKHEVQRFKDKKYEHEISLITCVKNEAPYIREWIEYHKMVELIS